jgi:flagellar hook-length control protein FliK
LVASDGGPDPDALTVAAAPAANDPVGPAPTDVADGSPSDASADGAPMRARVLTAGEGLSSKPSSLLVPQAVLADSAETASAHVASAPPATANAAGATGVVIAGATGQVSPSPPGSAQPPSAASSARPSAEAAAPPSPTAVAGTQGTGDTADGDFANAEQSFSSGAGTHAPLAARATGRTRPLASKPVIVQVAQHVGKAAKAGLTRIEIALEPASLGRVEVRLDFGRDGSINALFVADTREALDALRADARTLERALSEAGLETDSGSLGFSLREQSAGAGGGFSQTSARPNAASGMSAETTSDIGTPSGAENRRQLSAERRLDIRA